MAIAAISNSGLNGTKSKNFTNAYSAIVTGAKIGSTTGTISTTSYGSSPAYSVYSCTSGSGTIVIATSGYADLLLVGGGGTGGAGGTGGTGGGGQGGYGGQIQEYKNIYLSAGTYNWVCGGGGSGSSFGIYSVVGGPGGASQVNGASGWSWGNGWSSVPRSSTIRTGSSVTYCTGGAGGSNTIGGPQGAAGGANTGDGGGGNSLNTGGAGGAAGGSGLVVLRVQL